MARAILLARAEEERLDSAARMEMRLLREESRPLHMPERQFKKLYRLSKIQFVQLCREIVPLLPSCQRSTGIKPELKILAAIAFYAHGSYQKNIGAMFHLGLCQTSISIAIKEVTNAFNQRNILQKYIKFPQTGEERDNIAMQFMNKFGFPGVLGCIDGSHVAIVRPSEREEDYFNRKGYHSLNVMIICDADLIIRHVDASFGGAAHDSHIWNCSPVKQHMEELYAENQPFWLLGDSGYAQRPWLMQPVLQALPNTPEEHYTNMHCKTRNVVERCLGVLKTRWRCLLAHRVLHYSPIKAGKITNACVVLHNFIKDPTINIDRRELELDRANQPVPIPPRREFGDEDLIDRRDMLINRLWQSRHGSSM